VRLRSKPRFMARRRGTSPAYRSATMRSLPYFAFALALVVFSRAFAGAAALPDVDQVLAQTREAFLSARTAETIAAIEILCRTNLALISLKERDQLTARALSLLNDNKLDEANDVFARVRELERLGLNFRERACEPPLSNRALPPEAALSPKTTPDAKAEKAAPPKVDTSETTSSTTADSAASTIAAPPPEPPRGVDRRLDLRADRRADRRASADVNSFKPATSWRAASDTPVGAPAATEPQRENASSAKTAEDGAEAAQAPREVDSHKRARSAPTAENVAAAPTEPPQIASSGPSVPTERAKTIPPLPAIRVPAPGSSAPTIDATAIAPAPEPPLDAATSPKAAAQAHATIQPPSGINSSGSTASPVGDSGTSVAAMTPWSPSEAASSPRTAADRAEKSAQAPPEVERAKLASSAPLVRNVLTAAPPRSEPAPEAIAGAKAATAPEAGKASRAAEPKLADLSPSSASGASPPDATPVSVIPVKHSLTSKRQSRPSPERKKRIVSGSSPSKPARRVVRTSKHVIPRAREVVVEPISTLRRAANSGDPASAPLPVVLHRRCPSILASQDEYDNEVVSLCARRTNAN
jgi:hypothetical protein